MSRAARHVPARALGLQAREVVAEYRGVVAAIGRLREGERVLAWLGFAQCSVIGEGCARLMVRAICGPDVRVEFKRIGRSWAGRARVSLACDDARRVSLCSVLHECAHVVNRRTPRALRGGPHGEAFVYVYARLLRVWVGQR